MTAGEAFAALVEVMHRLRAPGGCPWDGEQTHDSLKPYLIEEAYEVIEALDAGDDAEFCSELGDLLLQVLFHAEIAQETNRFSITDVTRAITEKMIRRHPHVFADTKVSSSAEVLDNWSKIKAEERKSKNAEDRSALAGVPRGMPALLRAQRLGEKAGSVGFDWNDTEGVIEKMREELGELEEALRDGNVDAAAKELGDLLFACTSLARHIDRSAEDALTGSIERFVQRFRFMEDELSRHGREIRDVPIDELEALWQVTKRRDASQGTY
jgi:tetrapyrrole methylase family protein/MazG family protein